MFDLTTRQLNEVLYRERLQAAEAARERRMSWAPVPSPIGLLWRATATWFVAHGRRARAWAYGATVVR